MPLAEISKLMEGKQQQDDKRGFSSNPTVDELLKMLSGKRSGTAGNNNKPPPVPPKPRTNIESSQIVGERGFRNYFSGAIVNTNPEPDEQSDRGELMRKFDAIDSGLQRDDNEQRDYTTNQMLTQPRHNTACSNVKYLQFQQLRTAPAAKRLLNETSTMTEILPPSTDYDNYNDNEKALNDDGKHHSVPTSRPIVTESPEEANNNNVYNNRNFNSATILNQTNNNNDSKSINISTVEILEVPLKQRSGHNSYGNCNNPTFSRSQSKLQQQRQHQLFHENNSYAAPIVTSATDDDEDQSENEVILPTEIEVESILNESSHIDHPPRTSTPTNRTRYQHKSHRTNADSSPTSGSSNETTKPTTNDTNANRFGARSEQRNHKISLQEDEDLMNSSRDTDELANTSILNQSGGCELIGVNDNSDSKESPRVIVDQDKVPYTVQIFNETIMSSSISPPNAKSGKNNHKQHYNPETSQQQHSHCEEKIDELEKLTSSLFSQIDKLKNQVESLSSKVDELETSKLQENVSSFANNNSNNANSSTLSAFSKQPASYSPPNNMLNYGLSQSTSTINRLSSQINSQQTGNVGLGPMSTYSRSHVATISRNSNPSPGYSSNGMSSSMSCSNKFVSSSSSATKPLKKTTAHASTNSLYAESIKSGSTSISPTPINRQSTSPNSLMNLSTSRRDPMYHTSMLSLSSIGQQSGSLKKAQPVSGSVSNLSQVGSQLSNWPSTSDFIQSKHRAKDIFYSEEERLIRMVLYNILITMRIPSWVEDNYNIDKVVEPPSVRLKLDWVHGYRGRDCRSNIFFLPTGECVYFVASIVVLYNPEEKTQRHYLGHTDSVKCLAVHPNKLIIASGQSAVQSKRDKRPIVRVWNTVSMVTLRVIGFNEDYDRSICCLAFSKHDLGATLAVVDESNEHTITLLDWQRERNWRLAETNSGHEPVLAIDFHPIDKYSLVAVGKSSVNFWDVRGMTLTKKAGLFDKFDKPKYVICLTFNDLGDTITGDSNGNIIIWPRGSNRPKRVIHSAHNGGVFSVLAMKDGSYLTGGRDRRIIEWDENFNRTGREAELPEHCGGVRYITYARGSDVLIGTLRNSILLGSLDNNFVLIMQGHTEATSSLAIHPNQCQYLTGGFDDQIHLFNAKTHEVLWTKCLMMPATAACFSPNGCLLVVGSTLGKWLVIDAINQEILFTKCDGSGTFSCIKFSPNGEYFSMGSSDSQVYVYQTSETGNRFCRIGTCVGHASPVKEIDWSDDSQYLQTQSMKFELLFWKAMNCRPLDDEEIIDDLRWFTHNCTLGFSVIGIWSDSIDSALINYCDKSNNEDLMVSVTDAGNINIFKWPPCYNQCLSQKYYGNVDRFNFIKFLPDDSRLIAIGAKNCVTMEWIVDKGESL